MTSALGRQVCTFDGTTRTRPRRVLSHRWRRRCVIEDDAVDRAMSEPPPPQLTQGSDQPGGGSQNGLLAGGAVGFGIGLFVFTRVLTGGPSFSDLEAQAVPYDLAQMNDKPTVVEFYANWCEVCREMLSDTVEIEQTFGDQINYVALNVENGKWTPEMLQYGVDGIPHFVFLDASQSVQGTAVGRLPRRILEADLKALIDKTPLPFKQVQFETSSLKTAPSTMSAPVMPRDHGY